MNKIRNFIILVSVYLPLLGFIVKQSNVFNVSNSTIRMDNIRHNIRLIDAQNLDEKKLLYCTIIIDDVDSFPGKNYDSLFLHSVYELTKDKNKDLAAFLVLYHLTQDTTSFYYLNSNIEIDVWRTTRKKYEIDYWENRLHFR